MRQFKQMTILFAVLILLLGLARPANADDFAYMVTKFQNFGIIDLNTGAYTQIGNMGQLLAGLGEVGGKLYGGLSGGNVLYEVDSATGALTTVGTGGMNYLDFGSTISGLYAFDSNLNLFSVNPSTGATTFIGSTGLGASGNNVVGSSDNSNTLYLTDYTKLYAVNTTNGVATLIGDLGASQQIGAMVFENGTLYGGVNKPSLTVDTINVTSGAATPIANLNPTTFGNFWGLAPVSVPEPASLLLVLIAVGLIVKQRN